MMVPEEKQSHVPLSTYGIKVFIWSFGAVISAGKMNIKTEDWVNSESIVFQVRLYK